MNITSQEVRIDQWLWAVRIFKTRTIATDEIKKGRVVINGVTVKPSRIVRIGDVLLVKKPPIIYSYKVTGITDTRGSFQVAQQHYENLTPEEEFEKLKMIRSSRPPIREKGTGRPTKKERRDLDKFIDS